MITSPILRHIVETGVHCNQQQMIVFGNITKRVVCKTEDFRDLSTLLLLHCFFVSEFT